jgi:sugar diacid utilization regulator
MEHRDLMAGVIKQQHKISFIDYLDESTGIDDYQARVKVIVTQLGFSDISITEFGANEKVLQHYQTFPEETALLPGRYNLISLYAVKTPETPTFFSDTVEKIQQSSLWNVLDDIAITLKALNDLGYSECYNYSFKSNDNTTILLSLLAHDLSKEEFKKRIARTFSRIKTLKKAIQKTFSATLPTLREISRPQKEALQALADCDEDFSEIAQKLGISRNGFKDRLSNIRKRTGIIRHGPLIAHAFREKQIE